MRLPLLIASISFFFAVATVAFAQVPEGMPTTQAASIPAPTHPLPPGMKLIFDGKTLDGWVQAPPHATNFSGGDILNLPGLRRRIEDRSDRVAALVAEQLDEPAKAVLTTMPADAVTRDGRNAIARALNKLVTGPSIYDANRFKNVRLRAETTELLKTNPQGEALMRLNRVLLEDAFPAELGTSPNTAWFVKDGILASTGAGRGVIYTKDSYDRYRIIFDVRHVWGQPDHRAGVLVFCTPPSDGERPMDALGGIQFQVPNGGSWDYRRGKNNSGRGLFTRVLNPRFDEHHWSRVEILVDPASGTARMAVAQPVGTKAVEVLTFTDPTAGQKGPFALQMHNKGLFDEFANIAIEIDPKENELITVK